MIDLSGRTALVTGGSRGIGKACALRLAEAGADVIINYLTSRTAAENVAGRIADLGRRTAVVKADVGEPDDVAEMIDFVEHTFGSLDVLINNAATGGFRPLMTTTARQFDNAMDLNARSLIVLLQAALPLLTRNKGRAKVVSLSSHGSRLALPHYGLIGATKAALESLTRGFALEIGQQGVNLNVVLAGLVDTDAVRGLPNHEALLAHADARKLVPGHGLRGRDVADAVLFLSSPMSDMIQGQVLVVDGGVSVHAGG